MILLFISPFSLPLFHPSLYSTIDTYSLTLIRFLLLFPLIQLPTLIAPTPVRNHHLSVLHLTFPAIYYFPHLPDSTSLFFPSIYHLQPPIQLLSPFFFQYNLHSLSNLQPIKLHLYPPACYTYHPSPRPSKAPSPAFSATNDSLQPQRPLIIQIKKITPTFWLWVTYYSDKIHLCHLSLA